MAKFNPTIIAYLVSYITEGYDFKNFVLGESAFHIIQYDSTV